MKTELIDVSPTRKEIKIEIEPELVRAAYDSISDRYAKLANVPGFRRGHAPRSVVRSRFKSEIRSEVLRELVPNAISDAIDEHSLQTIGEPDVKLDNEEALEKLGNSPISVKVNVEVLPQIELQDYKGLEVVRRTRKVNDDDVDKIVEGLRESSASLQPVEDRGAQLGDTVSVDFNGQFIDKPEDEDINVQDVDVVLGGDGVQQEFTDNLLGVRADDEKNFTVNYPDDFTSKGLAGKRVEYSAKVTAVRIKELPEIDDEWARSLGDEFTDLATLRDKISQDLEARAKNEAEHRVRADLVKQLSGKHQFELPETLVEHQTSHRLESIIRDMVARGIDPRNQELNWQGAREEMKSIAEDDLRGSMLLERIADEENLTVSEGEIEAEIEAIAAASRQSKEQVRAALTKDGGERSIAGRMRNRKALDLLLENAKITDEELKDESTEVTEERKE